MGFTSLYIGSTGLKSQAAAMGTLGNNIANVNTLAYKSQTMHFATLMSTELATGEDGVSQKGMGVALADTITNFTQGSVTDGNSVSDLAIDGKGYFQVSDGENSFYTRAGNFRFDSQGYLVDPYGNRLQAREIDNGELGSLGDFQLDTNDGAYTMPGQATSILSLGVNLGIQSDLTQNEDNPFFSLLSQYQTTGDTALSADAYGYINSIRIYDEEGNAHTLNIYYDQAGVDDSTGNKYYEFVVSLDRNGLSDSASAAMTQPLMAGVLTFDGQGELLNMAGYTLASGGSADNLADWQLADIAEDGGLAVTMLLPGSSGQTLEQTLSLDFGLTNSTGAWASGASATAADLGSNPLNLPDFGGELSDEIVSTALGGDSGMIYYTENGYATGWLQNMTIGTDGLVTGIYTNGQSQELYQIPLFYFTNPYGLENEGGNLLSATAESGAAREGQAGDKAAGLGGIHENSLETSNVDLAQEFVSMILIQRGFQANSKIITTTEQILQNAIQMKR